MKKCGCVGPRGPQGLRGPEGPPGSGVPCVSSDPGNVATMGADGCVFVPPGAVAMQGSTCIGVTGDGSAGTPFTPAPVLNPAGCNALRCTPSGLLVPRTVVAGISGPAPGRIANDLQSIDVVVNAPAADACPQTYTVEAYLTPLRGEAGPVADVSLLATRAGGTWANTTLQVVLPDPGVYLIAGDMDTQICATVDAAGTTNLWTEVRLVHAQTGAVELANRHGTQHQFSTNGTTRFQHCMSATTSLSGLVTVTAAQGTKTVRVQAALRGPDPTGGSTIESSYFRGSRSYLTFVKIAD
ncbi:hypothetical protein ABZ568_00465 [Streptomyces olindensis]|uniref:Collagen-like protein n=1 Tax=Streptomyces olindensis TaxID=358823 RepID=A0ABV2XLR3_9ACTN